MTTNKNEDGFYSLFVEYPPRDVSAKNAVAACRILKNSILLALLTTDVVEKNVINTLRRENLDWSFYPSVVKRGAISKVKGKFQRFCLLPLRK